LKAGFDPQKFTIDSSAPLLKRPDAWKDLARSAKPIEAAIRKMKAT